MAPGMVRGRFVWQGYNLESLVVERLVDIFSRDYLGLFGLLVENGVGQGFAFVEDENVLFGVHARS